MIKYIFKMISILKVSQNNCEFILLLLSFKQTGCAPINTFDMMNLMGGKQIYIFGDKKKVQYFLFEKLKTVQKKSMVI